LLAFIVDLELYNIAIFVALEACKRETMANECVHVCSLAMREMKQVILEGYIQTHAVDI
jgi:hypothetical protein